MKTCAGNMLMGPAGFSVYTVSVMSGKLEEYLIKG